MRAQVTGRSWVFGDGVNTDEMYPGFAMRLPIHEAAQHVFEASRPGWSQLARAGDVVVGGSHFGLGSSRPVPLLFQQLGIAAIVAEQFNSLFFRNCINYGLLAVQCRGVTDLIRDGDEISIDLPRAELTVTRTGQFLPTAVLPEHLLAILDAGGLYPKLEAEGRLRPAAT